MAFELVLSFGLENENEGAVEALEEPKEKAGLASRFFPLLDSAFGAPKEKVGLASGFFPLLDSVFGAPKEKIGLGLLSEESCCDFGSPNLKEKDGLLSLFSAVSAVLAFKPKLKEGFFGSSVWNFVWPKLKVGFVSFALVCPKLNAGLAVLLDVDSEFWGGERICDRRIFFFFFHWFV